MSIVAIDAIMGSGKTSYIIDRINKEDAEFNAHLFDETSDDHESARSYMAITMYLDEADRFIKSCPDLNFIRPQPVKGRKLNHLNKLVAQGQNIASTHALFSQFNRETLEALKEANYTLIIDEVVDAVHQYEIKASDLRTLFSSNMVYVDAKKRLRWNHKDWSGYDGSFCAIMNLCDNGNLAYVDDTILMWEMPVDFLDAFSEVIVLTYLFEGSLMANYLRANGVPYQVVTLAGGELTGIGNRNEADTKAKLRELITVVADQSLNAIGTPKGRENPLSASWFRVKKTGGKDVLSRLKLNTENFFRNKVDGRSEDNMWTTFKDVSGSLKGPRYTKGFVPCNMKATNDYIDKKNLAYLVNIFVHPVVSNYLTNNDAEVDQDLFGLSEMVQWVWRSQIRVGNPITIYIPSQRMRTLFLDWLNTP